MRLIDADALIDSLELMYEHRDDKDEPYNIGVRGAINMTRKAPTIEPKRGEWTKRTKHTLIAQVNFAYCSECGQPIMHEHTRTLWNFCPNCGADMRGRGND